jgi:hypothetical protein
MRKTARTTTTAFKRDTVSAGEDLLREFVRDFMSEPSPSSRVRRARPQGLVVARSESDYAGLLFPESYVRGVLGIDRGAMLVEGASPVVVSNVVMMEHLIFEGWWDSAKKKVAEFIKDNPITSAVEAAKELGTSVNAVVVSLTQIVSSGGDAIGSVISGASSLIPKRLVDLKKATGEVSKRVKELAGKITNAPLKKWAEGVADKIASLGDRVSAKIKEFSGGSGWKGMMSTLVGYLAAAALASKIGPVKDAVIAVLSGEPGKMAAGAAKISSQVSSVVGDEDDDEDDDPPEVTGDDADAAKGINDATDAFRSLAMGLVKKALSAAAGEAIEQAAGPVAWVKKLGEIFEKVAGGISWVCGKILEALSRAKWPSTTSPTAPTT